MYHRSRFIRPFAAVVLTIVMFISGIPVEVMLGHFASPDRNVVDVLYQAQKAALRGDVRDLILVPSAEAAVASNGTIVYSDATEAAGSRDDLNFRTLTSPSTVGAETTTVNPLPETTGTTSQVRIVASPTRDEKIAVQIRYPTGTMHILKCTGGCDASGDWTLIGTSTNMTTAATFAPFDIAYEQLSGDFIIVYATSTSAGYANYCIYDGTNWSPSGCTSTGNFSGTASNRLSLTSVGVTGTPEWIRLKARGERLTPYRTDEMLIGISDSADDLYLGHWTGSAWDQAANPVDNLTTTNARKFDIAWEETTGEGMAIMTDTVDAAMRFSTYTSSGGWSAADTTNGPTNPATTAWNSWLELNNDPMSDDIAMIAGLTTPDADAAVWTGAAWTNSDQNLTNQETVTGKNVAVAFERFSGRAIFFNVASNGQDVDRHCWTSGGNFTTKDTSFISTTMQADDIEGMVVTPSPNSNAMIGLTTDIDDTLEGWTYSGATGCADGDFANTSTAQLKTPVGTIGVQSVLNNTINTPWGAAYTAYSPWSRNWRFYDGADTANTPTTALASENTAPTGVDPGSGNFRLRFSVTELSGGTQTDGRKKLQYATADPDDPATTWTDVGDVASGAIWRYRDCNGGSSVCDDNTTLSGTVLSGSPTAGWWVQDSDAAAGSNMDHSGLTTRELEFSVEANGAAANTTYYFRMFDTDQQTTIFREQDNDGSNDCASAVCTYPSLTTAAGASPPTVTTNFASNVGASSATLHGSITSNGGADATQHGFAYSTNSTLSSGVSTTTLGSYTGAGNFSSGIASLIGDTTYYFRAYATNSGGTGFGAILSFFTGNASVTRNMLLFEGAILRLLDGKMILHQR